MFWLRIFSPAQINKIPNKQSHIQYFFLNNKVSSIIVSRLKIFFEYKFRASQCEISQVIPTGSANIHFFQDICRIFTWVSTRIKRNGIHPEAATFHRLVIELEVRYNVN